MRILLIINPAAGKGRTKNHILKIKSFFSEMSCHLDIYETRKKGDALIKSRESVNDYDIIIAGGGDGTINDIVNGIANSKTKLGIIPLGTTNVFANEMGIPSDILESCKIIYHCKTIKTDLGKVNDNYFLQCAGIGFDASVLNEVQPILKKILGFGAYTIVALKKIINYKPPMMKLLLEGKEITAYFIIVSNLKSYGKIFQITPDARIDDGFLDVCLFEDKLDLINFIKNPPKIDFNKSISFSNATCFKARQVSITSPEDTLVQIDGDVVCKTPVTISVVPKSIEIICP